MTDTEQQALEALVQRLYNRFQSQAQSVVLFGSKARGDAGPDSDIDVLVALSDDDPQLCSSIRRLAARVSLEYDLLFSERLSRTQIHTDFRRQKSEESAFVRVHPRPEIWRRKDALCLPG